MRFKPRFSATKQPQETANIPQITRRNRIERNQTRKPSATFRKTTAAFLHIKYLKIFMHHIAKYNSDSKGTIKNEFKKSMTIPCQYQCNSGHVQSTQQSLCMNFVRRRASTMLGSTKLNIVLDFVEPQKTAVLTSYA